MCDCLYQMYNPIKIKCYQISYQISLNFIFYAIYIFWQLG